MMTRGYHGLELQERRKKLDGSSTLRFLLLLGLFSTSKNPFARARVGHEDSRGCYINASRDKIKKSLHKANRCERLKKSLCKANRYGEQVVASSKEIVTASRYEL
ncbi:hypothetical protein Taro_014781 [Colocasia esculenta]|uniref:Uncharacterized protein n=1 Tax=Colocasia esculenta TaxID=4460 RepID=A0A843U9V8_COLES|nr:hypothetical protein [Colocasia esculenta]